jgi:hypothetical protein
VWAPRTRTCQDDLHILAYEGVEPVRDAVAPLPGARKRSLGRPPSEQTPEGSARKPPPA